MLYLHCILHLLLLMVQHLIKQGAYSRKYGLTCSMLRNDGQGNRYPVHLRMRTFLIRDTLVIACLYVRVCVCKCMCVCARVCARVAGGLVVKALDFLTKRLCIQVSVVVETVRCSCKYLTQIEDLSALALDKGLEHYSGEQSLRPLFWRLGGACPDMETP